MKKLKNVDFPLAIAIMALLVIGCSRSLPFPKDCHTVKAKGIGQTVSQTATGATTVATITGDPLIAGTTEAEFSNIPSLDPNEAPFKGKLKLFTMHGTLTLRVYNGKLSPLTGVFSSDGDVVHGTGKFENATGRLFLSGLINTNDGSFTEDITGIICLNKPVQHDWK
ncbi:MAG: hypothetical protein WKF97_02780 [Chitinophagaceae bacterium]